MPIPVQCPRCNRVYHLKDEMAGQQVRCQCANVLNIPQPAQANMALMNLLSEELSRPLDAPPVRKAPTVMPPREKPNVARYSSAPQVPDPTKAPDKQFSDPFASPAERAAARKSRRGANYNPELHTTFVIITGVLAILFSIGASIITGISATRATDGISEIGKIQDAMKSAGASTELIGRVRAFMDWPLVIGSWLMLACSILVGVAGIGILCRQYWSKSLGISASIVVLLGIWVFHGYWITLIAQMESDKQRENPTIRPSIVLFRMYVKETSGGPEGLLTARTDTYVEDLMDRDSSVANRILKVLLWAFLYSLAPIYILWWMFWAGETDLTGW